VGFTKPNLGKDDGMADQIADLTDQSIRTVWPLASEALATDDDTTDEGSPAGDEDGTDGADDDASDADQDGTDA
jgi:hypothetical protein